MNVKLRKMNIVNKPAKHNFNQYYQKMFTVEPREILEFKEKIVIVKKEWTFPISLMAPWKPLKNSQLMECFEVDWSNARIPKIIKNETDLDDVKQYLRSIYKWYLFGYRYYASLNPIQDIWCIQSLCFLDIINDCQIIDENIGMADVEIKYVAAISDPSFKGNPRNPDRGLVRHQFMEVIVRLAEEKFVKSKVCESYFEAVKKIIEEHFIEKFKRSFHFINTWREKYYWIEECDIVLKYYKDILLIPLYDAHSGKKTKPGKKKFMCLDEFNALVQKGQLFGDTCGERQMYMAFNLGMMVQVDELNSDRMFQMSFVEYLEALTRMADAVSLKSPSPISSNYEDRTKQPLYLKLEGLCYQLFRILGDPEIKETTVITPLFVEEVAKDESTDEEKQVYSVESFSDVESSEDEQQQF